MAQARTREGTTDTGKAAAAAAPASRGEGPPPDIRRAGWGGVRAGAVLGRTVVALPPRGSRPFGPRGFSGVFPLGDLGGGDPLPGGPTRRAARPPPARAPHRRDR